MSEAFELVRSIRQHLRRSVSLLDQGRFGDALAEVELALALDAHSLPAQALRDRIQAAKATAVLANPRRDSDLITPARSFVPQGVNAASWRGFEQRITERRFKALLETINTSIVMRDSAAARTALEEARELRPGAPELADFETRVAAVPVVPPALGVAPSRIWIRAMGAAALFLVGVSMLLGLEWMRPGEQASPAPMAAPGAPAVTPTRDLSPADTPELGPVPVAINDEDDSVPAIETPPEPLLRPRVTTGITPPDAGGRPEIASRPVAMRNIAPSAVERTIDRRPAEEDTPEPDEREIPDDFVATPSRAIDIPVTAEARVRPPAPTAASLVPAIAIPPAEQGRVEEVLRRYARAYGELDASAARAVWPSVDEKALARAFQNLSSQNVSFADCDIDIRGVVANASCRGQASYAPKVGNREQRTESRLWRFELRRDGDAWKIENAEARRQSSAEYR